MESVKVFRVTNDAQLPVYQKPGDAGCDAYSTEDVVIMSGGSALIDTGLIVEIPSGYEIQVRSRSGIALKNNVFVLNSPGTIDEGFRNNIKVILFNLGKDPFVVKKGDRVAQFVLNKVEQIAWVPVASVTELSATDRGTGGFGHTDGK